MGGRSVHSRLRLPGWSLGIDRAAFGLRGCGCPAEPRSPAFTLRRVPARAKPGVSAVADLQNIPESPSLFWARSLDADRRGNALIRFDAEGSTTAFAVNCPCKCRPVQPLGSRVAFRG